jgi:pimeloyl-ACP methyl ester carboxylesterase
MTTTLHYGPDAPDKTYGPHSFPECSIDLGEVTMNYVVTDNASLPALLLIPGQTESWWGYEKAMGLLERHFQCFAVDLRGQGRTTRTPGRYTLDNIGSDLVRFIWLVIQRPVIVSGLSSGGLVAAWLSAYGVPGSIRGVVCEDPPFFSSELNPAVGPPIGQATGPFWALLAKHLGDQWSVGDWNGLRSAASRDLPPWLQLMAERLIPQTDEPSPELKEYDPEWARVTCAGGLAAGCDYARMLASIETPVLYTHHLRRIDPRSGGLIGTVSDQQAELACELMRSSGQRIDYRSFPTMGHRMHVLDPQLFAQVLVEWTPSVAK